MTRLGAFDALSRGIANVRANPAVIGVAFAGMAVVSLISIASMLPWMGLFGVDAGELLGFRSPTVEPGELLERLRLLFSPGEVVSRLWIGFLSFAIGLTVASFVYAWYWGGILGVLAAGEAQAPPGGGRPAVLFRTWSPQLLAVEGRRMTIRLLLFWAVLGLGALAGLLLLGLAVALGFGFGTSRGIGAGVAVGCGVAIPVVLLLIVLAMGTWVGQLELVDRRHGVRSAIRAGFELLGRRLGACLGLLAVYVALGLAVSIAVSLSTAVLQLLAMSHPVASLSVTLINLALQWIGGSVLSVTFAAAGLALVRSERALEPVAE